jgi:hypothetical protein
MEPCEGDYEEKVRVLTNRRTPDFIEVTVTEAANALISWIIRNKKLGFVMDW